MPENPGQFFSYNEMKCPCCGECHMDSFFMHLLDKLREACGQPLPARGYRCPTHDKEVGGDGNHPTGKAVDIACTNSHLRFLIIYYAIHLGFTRIGIYNNHIHLDICGLEDGKPTEVIWWGVSK